MCVFFFFKQKTAYELRISDWSSDVCSSDLATKPRSWLSGGWVAVIAARAIAGRSRRINARSKGPLRAISRRSRPCPPATSPPTGRAPRGYYRPRSTGRSEEHTSELQSLMRISYAVFCLKKKTQQQTKRQSLSITSKQD